VKILYGVQIQGQGHINRSAEMIQRLRARGHQVEVFASGQRPPVYAKEVLGDFDFVSLPLFSIVDGRLQHLKTWARLAALLPRQFAASRELASRLTKERFDLVLSDFEPVSSWAAGHAGVPGAGIAAQYRMTHTNAAKVGTRRMRLVPELGTRACAAGLDTLFAVSFSALQSSASHVNVVGPIVDSALRSTQTSSGGFFLVYLSSYSKARILASLPRSVPFKVYGLDCQERHGDIEFLPTSRRGFLCDLAACEGVVLGGSFQGVCEAAVLGKRVLCIPLAGYYEELFCAEHVQRSGLGRMHPTLERQGLKTFVADGVSPAPGTMGDGAADIIEELAL